MKNNCKLCGHEELKYSESFWGSDDSYINIAVCECCQSFIPEYKVEHAEANATDQQVKFHEDWWEESDKEELEEVLSNVKNLVIDLKKYLGPTISENIILELGSGRGSLLRALLDTGYNAYGCEPSKKLVTLARQHYGLSEHNLHNIPGADFLERVVPTINGQVNTFILWHVLEHLENPLQLLHRLYDTLNEEGSLILQLPLFCKQYIYPEHYFFPSQATLQYIAKATGFQVEAVNYDLNNLFITICYRKSSNAIRPEKNEITEILNRMSPFSQALFIRDKIAHQFETSIAAQTEIINDKIQSMATMDAMIDEREKTIAAQTVLINEKLSAMSAMSAMIDERDKTIAAQTALIDENVLTINSTSAMIDERDKTIAIQTSVIEEKHRTIDLYISRTEELDRYKSSWVFKVAKTIRLVK